MQYMEYIFGKRPNYEVYWPVATHGPLGKGCLKLNINSTTEIKYLIIWVLIKLRVTVYMMSPDINVFFSSNFRCRFLR